MSAKLLKIIALVSLILDCIGAFIPGAPIVLRWMGRLAAPLLFYCMAMEFSKTKDRKRYVGVLYFGGIAMSVLNLIIFYVVGAAGLSTTVTNNLFTTLFAGAMLIEVFEYANRHPRRRVKIWFSYASFQVLVAVIWALLYEMIEVPLPFLNVMSAVCGNAFATEGAFLFVSMALIFYLTREEPKKLSICYALLCLIYFLNSATGIWGKLFMLIGKDVLVAMMEIMTGLILWGATFTPMFDFTHMFLRDYQWMMLVALPLLLSCHPRKGREEETSPLLYLIYPGVIYLLWFVGTVIFG